MQARARRILGEATRPGFTPAYRAKRNFQITPVQRASRSRRSAASNLTTLAENHLEPTRPADLFSPERLDGFNLKNSRRGGGRFQGAPSCPSFRPPPSGSPDGLPRERRRIDARRTSPNPRQFLWARHSLAFPGRPRGFFGTSARANRTCGQVVGANKPEDRLDAHLHC